jgi:hypothetical protein
MIAPPRETMPVRRRAGERDVPEQHAGVDGEVIDALFGLLDQRVTVDVPGQLLWASADLLQRLVDRDRANRHGGVAQYPLARKVNVWSGRQVHDRVGAPQRRPAQLLDLLFDRGGHCRVADVRVHLHREAPADDHRLELRVIDVGGNDSAPARHLRAHELGLTTFPYSNELHLRRDDPHPRVVPLRDGARPAKGRRRAHMEPGPVRAGVRRPMHARRFDHVAPAENPGTAQRRHTVANVDALQSARVVHAKRWLAAAERNLAHRHAELAALDVHLARIGKGGFEVGLVQRSETVSSSHATDHSSQGSAGSAPNVPPHRHRSVRAARYQDCPQSRWRQQRAGVLLGPVRRARNRFSPRDDSGLRSAKHSARIYAPGRDARNGP